MKQYQINNAYASLCRLSNLQMPVLDAYNLYMLTEKIRTVYNFGFEQEKKIIAEHNGVIEQDGHVQFPTEADEAACKKDIRDLSNLDVDVEFKPITIQFDHIADQRIMAYDITCLQGFVTFK